VELPAQFVDAVQKYAADYLESKPRMQALKQSLSHSSGSQGSTGSLHHTEPPKPSHGHPSMSSKRTKLEPSNPYVPAQVNALPTSSSTAHRHSMVERYVLLLVRRGDQYLLSQISVHHSDDNTFFQTLRSEYLRLRGWLRNYLGIWRYSHCDFYQVP
jgi:hypothetical protein